MVQKKIRLTRRGVKQYPRGEKGGKKRSSRLGKPSLATLRHKEKEELKRLKLQPAVGKKKGAGFRE